MENSSEYKQFLSFINASTRENIVDETDLNKLRQKGIPEDEQRRNLMVKEYFFCKKYKKQIEAKAKKIYEKQMVTGGVAPYHCNYKVLESVADTYK